MRIFLPEWISPRWTAVVAVVIALLEVLEGTNPLFAGMQGLYLFIGVIAFNYAGGFRSAVGAYVFWFDLLTIPVGSIVKIIIRDPADSNSYAPMLSMTVYTISIGLLLLSVVVARTLTRNMSSLAERFTPADLNYRSAALGCFVVWYCIFFGAVVFPIGAGSVLGALYQVNRFGDVAAILASIDAVRASGGRKATSWLVYLCVGVPFAFGLASFSKEGIFAPIVCWCIGIAYTRFRLRWIHIAFLALFSAVSFTVLYPITQVGRYLAPAGGFSDHLVFAASMVKNIGEYREINAQQAEQAHEASMDYFSKEVGFAARLTRWPGDDRLIAYSARGHYVGYDLIWYSVLNWVPHALFPDKEKYEPIASGGNYYAREIGAISAQDTSTGISFGAEAEAFHMGGWEGVFMLMPAVWIFSFVVMDLVCGDLHKSPWGLLFALLLAHVAPEGALGILIYFIWYSDVGLILAMVFTVYAAPMIGSALISPKARFLPTVTVPQPMMRQR